MPERRFPPPWSVEETDACLARNSAAAARPPVARAGRLRRGSTTVTARA